MPQEYQDIIMEVFGRITAEASAEKRALDEKAMKDMEDYGIKVYVPRQEEIDAAAAHMREVSWPKLEEVFGKELMDQLRATFKK